MLPFDTPWLVVSTFLIPKGHAYLENIIYLQFGGIVTINQYADNFLDAAKDWICESSFIDVRFIAGSYAGEGPDDFYPNSSINIAYLWDAAIYVNPLPFQNKVDFDLKLKNFRVGQQQLLKLSKSKVLEIIEKAVNGAVMVNGDSFHLHTTNLDYFSESIYKNRWFYDLHLNVTGPKSYSPSALRTVAIDNGLRLSNPPFDGMADVASWLGLPDPSQSSSPPSISIRVAPPLDMMVSECSLDTDELFLKFHAHPKFDVSRVNVAVRALPGFNLETRKQISSEIEWKRPRNGLKEGTVRIKLKRADAALAILMISDHIVRRHWFIDPSKARNNRLITFQIFDKDLTKVKQALFTPSNGEIFEKGVTALLFLLGFSPAMPLQDDAPDIVVMTPSGRLVIVECTIKIKDFHTKLGKLVDRKGELINALKASDHHAQVDAVLICGLPISQIAVDQSELKNHNVMLMTKQNLEDAIEELRHPTNPDGLLDNLLNQLKPTTLAM